MKFTNDAMRIICNNTINLISSSLNISLAIISLNQTDAITLYCEKGHRGKLLKVNLVDFFFVFEVVLGFFKSNMLVGTFCVTCATSAIFV